MGDRLYYSIGEVAELVDVTLPTLRFWEKEFPFLEPKKNDKGSRFYTDQDIDNIRMVKYLLKDRRLTIEGARLTLKNDKEKTERTHAIVQKLRKIKAEIHALKMAMNEAFQISEEEEPGKA